MTRPKQPDGRHGTLGSRWNPGAGAGAERTFAVPTAGAPAKPTPDIAERNRHVDLEMIYTLHLTEQQMETLRRLLDIGIAYASAKRQDLAAAVEDQYAVNHAAEQVQGERVFPFPDSRRDGTHDV